MNETSHLNQIRRAVLDRVERDMRNTTIGLVVMAVAETVVLFFLVFLTDFKDRNHVLLLLSAFWVIVAVFAGVFGLGQHTLQGTRAVLKAIELLEDRLTGSQRS